MGTADFDPVDYAAVDQLAQNHVAGNVGLVVVTLAGEERRVRGYGRCRKDAERVPDAATLFEIGSITKVFTSCLLADMAVRGEVGLNDPVKKYLPESVRVPAYDGQEITLQQLATHTSSLPRLPDNLEATIQDQANPYANYTVEDLYAFLAAYQLKRPPGGRVEYSNLGVGLLGHALGLAAGKDYEELVRTRIAEPLGLTDTCLVLSPEQQQRLAPGHTADGGTTANWDMPTLAGAGAIRSTGTDMRAFLEACLGERRGPVQQALARCQLPRFGTVARPSARGLAAAVVLSLVAVGVQWFFGLQPGNFLFALAVFAPMLTSAWLFGLRPGLLATLLTVAGSYYLWRDQFGWHFTLVAGLLASWYLADPERQARRPMLGWQYQPLGPFGRGPRLTWHNGGTGGYASFLGFVKERNVGVVVLSNSENSVDDLAVQILRVLSRGR